MAPELTIRRSKLDHHQRFSADDGSLSAAAGTAYVETHSAQGNMWYPRAIRNLLSDGIVRAICASLLLPYLHAAPIGNVCRESIAEDLRSFGNSLTIAILQWTCTVAGTALCIWLMIVCSNRNSAINSQMLSGIGALGMTILGSPSASTQVRCGFFVFAGFLLVRYAQDLYPNLFSDVVWVPAVFFTSVTIDILICHLAAPSQGIDVSWFFSLLGWSTWTSITGLLWVRPNILWLRRQLHGMLAEADNQTVSHHQL